MTDYGHDLAFGSFLTPAAERPEQVLALAQLCDQAGLDLVTIQDHPYQARFLDTWTLLSVLAAHTLNVRLAPNVANLPLRPPAVLAHAVATLDILSGGRVELGLGAGAFWDAIAALGGPRRTPGEAVAALEEAIEVIRALWDTSARSVRVEGSHYQVVGAHPGPAPVHEVEIWLGAYRPRMLSLTGRLADGWLPSQGYAGPDALAAMNRAIDEAAAGAGRRPTDIRRLYNVTGSFGAGSGFLQGPPAVWAEQLADLTLTQGMSTYILGGDDADDLRRFAAEVAPAVRELVAAERGSGARPAGDVPDGSGSSTDPAAGRTARRGAPAAADDGEQPVFGVTATPDDGVRRSDVRVWDEATRPTGPPPPDGRSYTAHELSSGQHLVDVHDHLRRELVSVRDLVEQVAAGSLDAGAARSYLNTMTMRQNSWTLGTYCESYCRIVAGHHSLEDQSVFPHLRRSDPGLAPVIDRLETEHLAIHDVLEGVDRALVAFVSDPDGIAAVRAAVDLLSDVLLSHLAYEEFQLVEPLARLGFY